jgi:hypothetical protein
VRQWLRGAFSTSVVDPRGGDLEELRDFLDGQEFIAGVYDHDPFAPAANSLALAYSKGSETGPCLDTRLHLNAKTSMSLKPVPKVVGTDTTFSACPEKSALRDSNLSISREQARDQFAVKTDQTNFLGQNRQGENGPPPVEMGIPELSEGRVGEAFGFGNWAEGFSGPKIIPKIIPRCCCSARREIKY